MPASAGSRPQRPDPEVLEHARAAALEEAPPHSADAWWGVEQRIDRPQSTLFPLALTCETGVLLRAFYKVHRIKEGVSAGEASKKLSTARRVIERGGPLTRQFRRLAGDGRVAMPSILAADPDGLTEVQVALDGAPISRTAVHAIPGRRSPLIGRYRTLGTALSIIENCDAVPPSDEDIWRPDLDRAMNRLNGVLPTTYQDKLRARFEELFDRIRGGSTLTYCHGDLNHNHILFAGDKVGLIDPLWAVRWRGYDAAHQAWRLEQEIPSDRRLTERLTTSLLEGYGESGLPQSPEWHLTRVWHDMQAAARSGRGLTGKLRQRRAVHHLIQACSRPVDWVSR